MLRGDISNHGSYSIGFRCENSLLKYKDKTFIDHIANVIRGKNFRADVDDQVYSLMRYLYWNTEYTVSLVIDDKNYTEEAKRYLADFPFNSVVNVLKNVSEVTMMLNTGELTYYVSNDILDRQRVNSKYAVSVDEFNTLFRRRVLRP